MAEVILKNIKKVYPHQDGKKKKKKGAEERRSNLTVTDEGVLAVHDFNLSIKDKEFIVLVGPSGCGKSTTLRMVAGLEEISGRRAVYRRHAGERRCAEGPRHRDGVPELRALSAYDRVAENMAFPLKLRKVPKEEIDAARGAGREHPRHHRVPRPQAEGALRRPASARRHRPRHRARTRRFC